MSIHDLREEKIVQHYEAHHDSINDIAVHPSGNFVTSVSGNSEIKVLILIYVGMGFEKRMLSIYDVRTQRLNKFLLVFAEGRFLCNWRK